MAVQGRGLADDLVVEILRRLPAEQLWWSCRIVCKTWNSLIASPYFRQLHLQQPSPSSSFVLYDKLTEKLNFYFPRDDDSMASFPMKTCLLDKWKHQMVLSFWASCNGLVLFKSLNDKSYDYYIGNPITGELKSINIPDIGKFCGFFYHSSTQQYKLLFRRRRREYAVVTIGSTEWKSLCAPPYSLRYESFVIVNNNLYWMIDSPRKMENSIMMFSMETEEFCTMSRPGQTRESHRSFHLLEMEGRLACWRSSVLVVQIWVFEVSDNDNHIDQEHWTQIYNIDLKQVLRSSIFYFEYISKIVSIQNGELILLFRQKWVFRYNLSTNTAEKIELEGISNELFDDGRIFLRLTRYTKTLASLNNF